MEHLATVGTNVQHLLDLPQTKTDEIKRIYHSPIQRREAYLDLYTTDHPCPRWRQIVSVLHQVEEPRQADVVENTYIQGTYYIYNYVHHTLL